METLKKGKYLIPEGCKAACRNGVITIVDFRSKNVKENRCRNCKFCTHGYACSAGWRTLVCLKKPKNVRRKRYDKEPLFYHVRPMDKICEYFEPKNE